MNSSYSYAETWQSLALQELLKNLPQDSRVRDSRTCEPGGRTGPLETTCMGAAHGTRGLRVLQARACATFLQPFIRLAFAQVGREDLSSGCVATRPRLLRPGDPADEGREQIGTDHRTLPLQGCRDACVEGDVAGYSHELGPKLGM